MALSQGAIAGFAIASVTSILYLVLLIHYLVAARRYPPPVCTDPENQNRVRHTRSEVAAPALEEQHRLEEREARKEFGHIDELVNHGSSQVRGIAVVREDRDLVVESGI